VPTRAMSPEVSHSRNLQPQRKTLGNRTCLEKVDLGVCSKGVWTLIWQVFFALKCFSFGLILCKIWFSPEHGYLIFFYFRLLKFWFSYVRANYGAYDQIVAVKRLNLDGLQGNQEFIVEVLMLSLLHHQNLVNLIGYCTDGDQRLLVYEFMSMGSLENHLYGNSLNV